MKWLHLIPAPLHRALYRVADRTRRRWWRIRKPTRSSVIVAAFDNAGRVLLVRHSYGPPLWVLPGGGIDRGEAPLAAAVREFAEELGCALDDVRPLRDATLEDSGSLDHLHVFLAQIAGVPRPDMREIVAAEFYALDALPSRTGRQAAAWVAECAALRRNATGS
ncbi:MAG: NUDIX domain-containing protein [Croceibacterium sp.]